MLWCIRIRLYSLPEKSMENTRPVVHSLLQQTNGLLHFTSLFSLMNLCFPKNKMDFSTVLNVDIGTMNSVKTFDCSE